jgi:ketosteroid isomerase-like protein
MTDTTPTSTPTPVDPAELPATVRAYLAAHDARDVDAVLACCTDDAVVVDEGRTYRGQPEIAGWMRRSASEYTYTSALTGAARIDGQRWIATKHLEGDFPGGVVDLDFRFTLRGDHIAELVIAP